MSARACRQVRPVCSAQAWMASRWLRRAEIMQESRGVMRSAAVDARSNAAR